MKSTEKALILGVIGILVAVISIVYVAKPNYDSMKATENNIVQLEARLAELNVKQADREKYIADTEKFNAEFDDKLNAFPADLNQEITIMFVEGIKDNNEFSVGSLEMGVPEQFYVLGQGGGDASLSSASTGTATTEAATTEAATTQAATDTTLAEGTIEGEDSAYKCYRAVFPMEYYGSYASLKDVIDYVGSYQDRMTINAMNITYDAENDIYSGELELYCYSIESSERPERTVDLNDIEIGIENIFNPDVSGRSSDGKEDTLNKYDDKDGAAIESNYDFYAMLNAASSDVSAKVVGQNGAGKEASVVSNSDNSVSTLSFDFYEKDGKNYCKYTLDTTSYEAEVTSAEDIKLFLQSSARKGDDDKAGIRVTIRNTTKLPVYVKVSGDDAASPRVDIANKTGMVKVYK